MVPPGNIGNITTGCHTDTNMLPLRAPGGHRPGQLNSTGQTPTSKSYAAPNLNSARVGKHELKGQYNDELVSATECHDARTFDFLSESEHFIFYVKYPEFKI